MGTIRRTQAIAVVAATGATVAVWAIAERLAGVDLTVRTGSGVGTQQVGPAAVVIVSLLAGLAGWALLAVLERFTRHAGLVWTIVALAVLVLSLAGPAGAVTAAAKLALACMHLAAAAVLIPTLARTSSAEPNMTPFAAQEIRRTS